MSTHVHSILILISLLLNSFNVECYYKLYGCKNIQNNSIDLQLKNHLFCDYDYDVRPTDNENNVTKIGLIIMPKIIDSDDMSNILSVHAWLFMNWTDVNLKWKPEDFQGVNTLHISSEEIWVPDITLHNSGDMSEDQMGIPKTDCNLAHNGVIMCISATKYSARCDSDYANYPYDVKNCSIELASWAYSSDEVSLFTTHSILMSDFTPNRKWSILSANTTTELQTFKMNETYSSRVFIFRFVIQRLGNGIHAVYIVPAIVLMVITLSVLWLDCQSIERMIVACIGFIVHLICIQDLFWSIPYNGEIVPNLLRFYENSFLLMAFALILTVVLREISVLTSSTPQWITSATSIVLRSKAGQLLLLSILDPKASAFLEEMADDNDDLVNPGKMGNSTWNYVTLIVGWFAFIVVLFAYVVMLAIFLPRNNIS